MMIGQIVFVSDENLPHINTGIITKRQRDPDAQYFWYEVFCNDGQNHVFPTFLLSPAGPRLAREYKKSQINVHNFLHSSTKHTKFQLDYIHNQTQKLK